MDNERIEYLHQRYLDGSLSPAEAAEWAHVLQAEEHEAAIHALMRHTWTAMTAGEQQSMPPAHARRVFRQVVRPSRLRRLRPLLSAAVILLVASVAFWFFRTQQQPAAAVLTTADVAPGGNRATLSLADGTTIDLSPAHEGVIIGDAVVYNDGTDVLDPAGERAASDTARPMVITTPSGGTYRVTLSDGTTVWLNAASTLTYPSRFSGNERRVTLAGEAYFSVTKDADRPFVVNSRDQRIEVIGTEFNVNAYTDEVVTTTTLVNGRVHVAAAGHAPNGEAPVHRLLPGQQSIFEQGAFRIQEVDTGQHTAWREGRFNFDGKTLPEVMRELARWYGIKVAYEGTLPNLVFYGGARRNNNLAMVLTLLETNGIGYRLTPDTTLILSATN